MLPARAFATIFCRPGFPGLPAVENLVVSPLAGVRHGGPGLFDFKGFALLQQLEGNVVRRTNEGHAAVARRAVDGDALFLQIFAEFVDVIDLVGEVAEIAAAGIFFRIPVVGQFQKRRLALALPASMSSDPARKDQGEPALFVFDSGGPRSCPSCCNKNRASLQCWSRGPSCAITHVLSFSSGGEYWVKGAGPANDHRSPA